MQSQTWKCLAAIAALALVAAACNTGNVAPPTSAPVVATTGVPPTAPATATSAASVAAPATAIPATGTVAAPSVTAAPTDSPTATGPAATPTAATNPMAHLAAGQAITITMIKMFDKNTGWALGGTGQVGDHVLNTSDGGQTWHDVTPPQPAPASDQQQPNAATGLFGNSFTAWVVYSSVAPVAPATAVVWRTRDSGQTWTASNPIDLAALGAQDFFQPSDIRFLPDVKTGWFIAHLGVGMNHDYFSILHTTDGGQTWTRLIDPTAGGPQSCQKTGLHFNDTTNGWLTGDCQGVAPGVFFKHSDDSGATWTDFSLPAPASQPDIFTRQDAGCGTYSLRFFDPQNAKLSVSCLILGANVITSTHFIYTTADGGQNWTASPSPARVLTFINPQVGWALPTGESNLPAPFALSLTQDGGQTWTTVKQLAWTGQLNFISPTIGWAVAQIDQAMSLVKTADGGHTWQSVTPTIAQ